MSDQRKVRQTNYPAFLKPAAPDLAFQDTAIILNTKGTNATDTSTNIPRIVCAAMPLPSYGYQGWKAGDARDADDT